MSHILQCHEIVKTDFVRAENCHLFDSQGRRFIDFESGIWCTALGHNHPAVNHTIETQLQKLMHLGTRYPNETVEKAAVEVLTITGLGEGKCIFLSSGSEAVEFAVQAVRRISGRELLLSFSNSYLAAFGSAGKKDAGEWFLLDSNVCLNYGYLEMLDSIPFEKIGGFIFEPGGSGSAFGKFPPKLIVQEIATRVRQAGGMIAANEITTGMGRTGKWFGYQHYDLQPDIVSLGKGLGNGYPVSAVAMKQEIAQSLEDGGLRYAQSHQNDPMGCAVASTVIRILREEGWIERGNEVGEFFLEGLQHLAGKHAIIREARGRGMLLTLEFKPHAEFSAEKAYRALLAKGFLTGYYPAGNVLRFDPALTVSLADIRSLLTSLDSILLKVSA